MLTLNYFCQKVLYFILTNTAVVWKGDIRPLGCVTIWNLRTRICEIRITYILNDHVNCDLLSLWIFNLIAAKMCSIACRGVMDLNNANLTSCSWFPTLQFTFNAIFAITNYFELDGICLLREMMICTFFVL